MMLRTLLTITTVLTFAASAYAAEVTTLPAGIGIDGGPAFAGEGFVVVEEGAIDDTVVFRGGRAEDGEFRVLVEPEAFMRSAADRFFVAASADRFAASQRLSVKTG